MKPREKKSKESKENVVITERLNKMISHRSPYSRREADELIFSGLVKVNHEVVTEPGRQVSLDDKITVKGKSLDNPDKPITVIVYNKPYGQIVSKNDPEGRPTVYDTLGAKFKGFIPIGRLDWASEGLLLLTDSPKAAQALMESPLERVYNVKIEGTLTEGMEKAMKEGLELKDARAGGHAKSAIKEMTFAPFFAYRLMQETPKHSKLKIAIGEGKNREIRRFFAHFGRTVVKLKRVSYGGIELNAVPTGKTRYLTKDEYAHLRSFLKDWDKKEISKSGLDMIIPTKHKDDNGKSE